MMMMMMMMVVVVVVVVLVPTRAVLVIRGVRVRCCRTFVGWKWIAAPPRSAMVFGHGMICPNGVTRQLIVRLLWHGRGLGSGAVTVF